MRNSQLKTIITTIIMIGLIFTTACSSSNGDQPSAADYPSDDLSVEGKNSEPFVVPDETLFGSWDVYGFVKNDIVYSIQEDSALESAYSGAVMCFETDGSFTYNDGSFSNGNYSVLAEYDGVATYLLTIDRQLISDGTSTNGSENNKYIVGKSYDSDYLSCAIYDEETGKAKDGEDVIVFGKSIDSYYSSNTMHDSFTNAYGTPTTKCAHSGCDNYIASSGDTNCCSIHSNKCLNCGKYIDEDAMYCMACLSSAGGKSTTDNTSGSKCKYKDSNGNQTCTNNAMPGGSLCEYHYNYLMNVYNDLTGN